jgi:hypothetical protein
MASEPSALFRTRQLNLPAKHPCGWPSEHRVHRGGGLGREVGFRAAVGHVLWVARCVVGVVQSCCVHVLRLG